jgi:3-deoxy-D-manno-octulosonic-acid transferase
MSHLLKLLYSIVYALTLPWTLYRLSRAGGLRTLPARFGYLGDVHLQDSVWLHASSVGEVTLLAPLIARLEQAHAETAIVISASTQTGLETARVRYPDHFSFPFPFDFAFAIRRCLRALRPRLVIVAESEFWPQFLTTVAEQGIPLAFVNAKMSAKSFRMHARTGFVAQALRRATLIATQSDEHEARLRALGIDPARIEVTGNMKYDLVGIPGTRSIATRERLGFGAADIVIIGGSLHDGEDELLLDATAVLRERRAELRLVIVPRYPADAARVINKAQTRGLTCVRKSEIDRADTRRLAAREVLVVDTLGELRDLYGLADIAFVGGSMFFRGSNKGGHNLMEPAVCGVPVVFGPYNFSFRETADDLVAADAGIQVDTVFALTEALALLAADPQRRREMGERARKLVLAKQGASARNFALLERALAG